MIDDVRFQIWSLKN